jgi:uncharacterized protein YegJ (DUF2314 family)
MKKFLIALALICAPSTALAQKSGSDDTAPVQLVEPTAPAGDQVVGYHSADQRMNNAIEQARTYLPFFLDEFRAASTQSREDFTVKVALPTASGSREHIWAGDLRFEGQQLVGSLINEPYDLPGLHLGSRVEIPDADISDWSILTPDGVYGGFTSRVMIDDMPEAEAAQYREALELTAQPVPPGWVQ